MHGLRFRQIHLDFHTSPAIPAIGTVFDKKKWQQTLLDARVDSITLFAKCHHGWSYHPTQVGQMHPHLDFDLLRAQYDACKEIGINVPVYLSAGVDNLAAERHPEWREIDETGRFAGWVTSPMEPGFMKLDFTSPYLDYLCEQAVEVARMFPDCDGIFSDITTQAPGCGKYRMAFMQQHGLDPLVEEDRKTAAQRALDMYYEKFTVACRVDNPEMLVFHNSGHIARGKRDVLKHFSHLELESLPTGGWGYDHFPMSARYVINLDHDFLGMTGKFHTTWGEFGGFKSANALRYECAAMIAFGAKCSIGDQLHPAGELDASTYRIIGEAYREVEAKEAWCDGVESVAQIGVLSVEAMAAEGSHRDAADPDIGAARVLLEGYLLFDLLDAEMDFDRYELLILPDTIDVTPALKAKIDAYLAQGGRLLLTGRSGLAQDGKTLLFDAGCEVEGESPFQPDFLLPIESLRPENITSPIVFYTNNHRIRVTDGQSFGDVYDPYFNRRYDHFCSHQHTPPQPEPSGYAIGSRKGQIAYVGHAIFTDYRAYGAVVYKDFILKLIRGMLEDGVMVQADLPSEARISLMHQPAHQRYVLHLLYAGKINRGGPVSLSGGTVSTQSQSVEVIDELLPLHDVTVELALPDDRVPKQLILEPQGEAVEYAMQQGRCRFTIDTFTCHQMVALHY